jgi:hypothetical protein
MKRSATKRLDPTFLLRIRESAAFRRGEVAQDFRDYESIPGLQLSKVTGRATEVRYKHLTIRALPEICA